MAREPGLSVSIHGSWSCRWIGVDQFNDGTHTLSSFRVQNSYCGYVFAFADYHCDGVGGCFELCCSDFFWNHSNP
jgi:hypothetical protein